MSDLLLSIIRIVEQKHGALRHSLRPWMSQDFTNSQQKCLASAWISFREKKERVKDTLNGMIEDATWQLGCCLLDATNERQ